MVHTYNCTKLEATGFAQFYLLYGHHPRLLVDLLFDLTSQDETKSPSKNAEKWARRMAEAYQLASDNNTYPHSASEPTALG